MSGDQDLVGRSVRVSVGEPWDFVSPDGANLILGIILEIQRGFPVKTKIVISVTEFEFKGSLENMLIATSRYVGVDVVKSLLRGRSITVNMIGVASSIGMIGGVEIAG